MANTKSAKKAVKTNERRRVRNQGMRSAVKTAFRKATDLIVKPDKGKDKKEEQRTSVMAACSTIDKAASKGIIHANTAARKKSRLAKKLNKVASK